MLKDENKRMNKRLHLLKNHKPGYLQKLVGLNFFINLTRISKKKEWSSFTEEKLDLNKQDHDM